MSSRDKIKQLYLKLDSLLASICDGQANIDEQDKALKIMDQMQFYINRVLIFDEHENAKTENQSPANIGDNRVSFRKSRL